MGFKRGRLNRLGNKVTIRDRDTMTQERVDISELRRIVGEKVDWRKAGK